MWDMEVSSRDDGSRASVTGRAAVRSVRLEIRPADGVRNGSIRNRITAAIDSATNTTNTVSCVSTNGGSDWVGAIVRSTGILKKACTDPDEDIEVQSEHRKDDVHGAPSAGELACVSRKRRNTHHDQGNRSHDVGGQARGPRETRTPYVGGNRGRQEHCRPSIEPLAGQQAEEDDETDANQTDDHVDDGVCRHCRGHADPCTAALFGCNPTTDVLGKFSRTTLRFDAARNLTASRSTSVRSPDRATWCSPSVARIACNSPHGSRQVPAQSKNHSFSRSERWMRYVTHVLRLHPALRTASARPARI